MPVPVGKTFHILGQTAVDAQFPAEGLVSVSVKTGEQKLTDLFHLLYGPVRQKIASRVIMEQGTVVEEGFVEDLKEKYILVKGEAEDLQKARDILFSISSNRYGFEAGFLRTATCLSSPPPSAEALPQPRLPALSGEWILFWRLPPCPRSAWRS